MSPTPREQLTLECPCGAVTSVEAPEVDVAAFMRVAIRDGWREIDDEPAIKTLENGCVRIDFTGMCSGCVEFLLGLTKRLPRA